jgi:hypothetical protein
MEPEIAEDDYSEEDTLFDPDLVAMVEVDGGVASFTRVPPHIEAIIVDYDNFPDAEIDWENGIIHWGESAQ